MSKRKDSVLVEQISVGQYRNFCYLVGDEPSKEAAIVDPAWDIPKIIRHLNVKSLKLKYVINTHSHVDHIQGNLSIQQLTNARIVMSCKASVQKDIGVQDGDELKLGSAVRLHFILTPGHSPDGMCVLVNDIALITGDTLFIGDCGRVDLPGGDASELFNSFKKMRDLDPMLIVYPGHDCGARPCTTLKEQLEQNYTLAKRSKKEFIRFMKEP